MTNRGAAVENETAQGVTVADLARLRGAAARARARGIAHTVVGAERHQGGPEGTLGFLCCFTSQSVRLPPLP